MMGYSQKEGKHGPIYQIANGISVTPDARGTWLLVLRRGNRPNEKIIRED